MPGYPCLVERTPEMRRRLRSLTAAVAVVAVVGLTGCAASDSELLAEVVEFCGGDRGFADLTVRGDRVVVTRPAMEDRADSSEQDAVTGPARCMFSGLAAPGDVLHGTFGDGFREAFPRGGVAASEWGPESASWTVGGREVTARWSFTDADGFRFEFVDSGPVS